MRLLVTLLATAGLAAPAEAAPRRVWEHARQMSPARIDCILARQEPAVRAWLGQLAGTKEEKRAFSRLQADFPICFGSAQEIGWTYHFEAGAVRWAIIRHLLHRDWAKVPEQAPARLADPLWYAQDAANQAAANQGLLAHRIGKCLARTDWDGARALAAPAATDDDAAPAFSRIIEMLPSCVPPAMTIKLDRERLRAIVEETVFLAALGSTHA